MAYECWSNQAKVMFVQLDYVSACCYCFWFCVVATLHLLLGSWQGFGTVFWELMLSKV
ncbi:hypothetical protein DITRI_Ditri09bG0066400 [Diplodiscus trichospermus]